MGKKILIAEDEIPIGKALQLKLTHAGYEAVHVLNGEEALDKIKSENFDLVILDVMMPKLDGFGVLEALKAMGNTVPVVISSNLSQSEDENKARELGAKDYFIKSNVPLANLVDRIGQMVGGPS